MNRVQQRLFDEIFEKMDEGKFEPNTWEEKFLDTIESVEELSYNQNKKLTEIHHKARWE